MLTDIVFWLVLYPFMTGKDFRLEFVSIIDPVPGLPFYLLVKKVILNILIKLLENVWPFLYSFIFVITLLEIIDITNESVVLSQVCNSSYLSQLYHIFLKCEGTVLLKKSLKFCL